jgi:hypothetical protein
MAFAPKPEKKTTVSNVLILYKGKKPESLDALVQHYVKQFETTKQEVLVLYTTSSKLKFMPLDSDRGMIICLSLEVCPNPIPCFAADHDHVFFYPGNCDKEELDAFGKLFGTRPYKYEQPLWFLDHNNPSAVLHPFDIGSLEPPPKTKEQQPEELLSFAQLCKRSMDIWFHAHRPELDPWISTIEEQLKDIQNVVLLGSKGSYIQKLGHHIRPVRGALPPSPEILSFLEFWMKQKYGYLLLPIKDAWDHQTFLGFNVYGGQNRL